LSQAFSTSAPMIAVRLDGVLEVRASAAAAGGADEDGNAARAGGLQDGGEVAREGAPVGERDAGAEVVRSRVGGAGVDGQHVGLALEPLLHRARGNTVAEHALGRQDRHPVGHRYASGHGTGCCMSGTCCWAP
jgi:hypothetical protein